MPPKPPFTYAQLIYKAIKAIDGKATLQEICTWISRTYDYYKYADGAWMVRSRTVSLVGVLTNEQSSVRHNLSSGRAFVKMERCGGDRGKGFFWSIDEKHAQALEEQEARMQQAAANGGGKDGTSKGKKKDKGTSLLEPPLKRSVKGDTKGLPLPPPLTNMPLSFKTTTTASPSPVGTNGASVSDAGKSGASNAITGAAPPTTGVFAYPSHPQSSQMVTGPTVTPSFGGSNPYAALTQTHWGVHRPTSGTITESPTALTAGDPAKPQASTQPPTPTSQGQQPIVPDVVIPIVLGPIPETHPDYLPSHRNNSAKEGYMILHERKLILDPDVFTGLTPEMLTELERMGARAALSILTGHMVRALKEKRAREREKNKDKGAKRGRGPRSGRRSEPAGSPFTKAPLEKRDVGIAGAAINGETDRDIPQSAPGQDNNTVAPPADPGSPIIVVVDSDEEGPAMKKRKVDGEGQEASMVIETSPGLVPTV